VKRYKDQKVICRGSIVVINETSKLKTCFRIFFYS